MSRVLIEVQGGVVTYVASDDPDVGVYLRDWDDIKEQGGCRCHPKEVLNVAHYRGCADISINDMDVMIAGVPEGTIWKEK